MFRFSIIALLVTIAIGTAAVLQQNSKDHLYRLEETLLKPSAPFSSGPMTSLQQWPIRAARIAHRYACSER